MLFCRNIANSDLDTSLYDALKTGQFGFSETLSFILISIFYIYISALLDIKRLCDIENKKNAVSIVVFMNILTIHMDFVEPKLDKIVIISGIVVIYYLFLCLKKGKLFSKKAENLPTP